MQKSKSNGEHDVRVPNSQVVIELGVSYQTIRRREKCTRKHIEEFGHPLPGDYPQPIWDNGRKYQLRSKLDEYKRHSGPPITEFKRTPHKATAAPSSAPDAAALFNGLRLQRQHNSTAATRNTRKG